MEYCERTNTDSSFLNKPRNESPRSLKFDTTQGSAQPKTTYKSKKSSKNKVDDSDDPQGTGQIKNKRPYNRKKKPDKEENSTGDPFSNAAENPPVRLRRANSKRKLSSAIIEALQDSDFENYSDDDGYKNYDAPESPATPPPKAAKKRGRKSSNASDSSPSPSKLNKSKYVKQQRPYSRPSGPLKTTKTG